MTGAAHAQMSGEAGARVRPITREEVNAYAAMLQLDPQQKSAVKELHRGYLASIRAAMKDGNTAWRACGDEPEPTRKERCRAEALMKFVGAARASESGWFADVGAVLRSEQSALMERVAMARARELARRHTIAGGARADPDLIIAQLGVPRTGAVAEALDECAAQVDRHAKAQVRLMQRLFEMVDANRVEGRQNDPADLSRLIRELGEESFKVQDINAKTLRQVMDVVPEERRDDIARAAKRLSFPTVYAPTPFEGTLSRALRLADLSADQRAELEALGTRHAREADSVRSVWAGAVGEQQRRLADLGLVALATLGEASRDVTESHTRMRDLDARSMARLTSLLTDDQRAALGVPDKPTEMNTLRDMLPEIGKDQEATERELAEGGSP